MNEKIEILSLTLTELEAEIAKLGEPRFRAKQVYEWIHVKKITSFNQMTNVSVQLRETLSGKFCINLLNIKKKLVSKTDNTVKYLYRLNDGEQVEAVLMSYKHGNSACISTQVGCKMDCAFCASGIAGFVRNISAGEMLAQIYTAERDSAVPVNSIVLMGIGEPLDNFDNVVKFLKIISDKGGRGMSLRHVSLSTCGLAERIEELANLGLGVTLSVSLHTPFDDKRSEIMPINRRYSIQRLLSACKMYFEKTGRRISFEYALIEGMNDDAGSADKLAALVKPLSAHVNIIRANSVAETDFRESTNVERFVNTLTAKGINATVRRTLGADIMAACGQLRRDNL